jgi:hypothetical protein
MSVHSPSHPAVAVTGALNVTGVPALSSSSLSDSSPSYRGFNHNDRSFFSCEIRSVELVETPPFCIVTASSLSCKMV